MLLGSFRPLSASVLHTLREQFSLEWTYHSNAIEGNTLSLRETQLVLQEGITIKGKSLREHFEAKNHEKAIKFLEQILVPKKTITEKDILRLHEYILEGIEEDFAGRYRNGQVRIAGTTFIPPNAQKVPDLMKSYSQKLRRKPKRTHLIQFSAWVHHHFVWIHPFFDGNGRTARLLMNILLMRDGYPPAIILRNDRKKYYDALERANHGDYKKMELIVGQAVERSLDIYLQTCGIAKKNDQYVLLSELAKEFPLSQEYLSLLARQGKIDAWKQSRNWYSTHKAVEDYVQSVGKKRGK